ncbi:MAG: trehalose-6-phosphate synthase [Dehalococcoidia bacterium]
MTPLEIGRGPETDPVQRLCQRLAGHRLIIASNRGPVSYCLGADGSLRMERGSGGIVTALTAASRLVPVTWVASAMTAGDRQAAGPSRRLQVPLNEHEILLHFVVPPEDQYHRFYNVISNPLLWFLQHYMWDSPHSPNITRSIYDAWEKGYVPVNEAFAETVAREVGDDASAYIMLHDYHLYLAPGMIRRMLPTAIVQHFTHIPWPSPRYWYLLPPSMRQAIIESLCAADIVGLQTRRDVRNFLNCCEDFLPGAEVDYDAATVGYEGREVKVTHYPIAIDAEGLAAFAKGPQVQAYEEELRQYLGEKTIVRVDRLEPSKNLVRGYRAYDILLRRRPDLAGRVTFLSFLVPSRTNLSLYQRYRDEVFEIINTINEDYGNAQWQPIRVFYEENYAQAVAAMRLYDVLLVNPLIDGMNLVAKEGPLVNRRDGVLILSETAGAYEQLGEHALAVAPADVEGTARALEAALAMAGEERRRRAATLRQVVQAEDIVQWLEHQLQDLAFLR